MIFGSKASKTVAAATTKIPTKATWGGPEVWEAVNKRRVEFGVGQLNRKDELCTIASIRLNQLLELGKLDGHAGFQPVLDRADLKWIGEKYKVPDEVLNERYQKSGVLKFQNQLAWARQYLVWEELLVSSKHGAWTLSKKGWDTKLNETEAHDIFLKWVKGWAYIEMSQILLFTDITYAGDAKVNGQQFYDLGTKMVDDAEATVKKITNASFMINKTR